MGSETSPLFICRAVAAHYGTAAVKVTRGGIGGGDVWKVEGLSSKALPLAVISFENFTDSPVGLFLFSSTRGMVKPFGWMLDDAVAFVDRAQNVGGVAFVEDCAHEYDSYCPRCGIDSPNEIGGK